MNSADDILDVATLCFEGDFDTQVKNLLYRIRLTASEVQNLRHLYSDLEQALHNLQPGRKYRGFLRVMPFGSVVTGLGIKTSDVDCYIALPSDIEPTKNIVMHAKRRLERYYNLFTNLFAITAAKVPIVKFLHIPTNCKCDVNFQSPAGVYNSELIGTLLHMDLSYRALNLAIIVKYWSKVHKITGTNLMASYCLTLMVIFYLQLIKILPPVFDMQKSVPPYIVDNWDMAFNRNMSNDSDNYDSLYDLIGGFFKCYANLNFEESIISPFTGRLIPKTMFTNLDHVPDEFEIYKCNVSTDLCRPLKIDTPMCVQDPFEHSRNCCGAVYPRLAVKIKAIFQFAAKKFDEVPREKFLEVVLTEKPPNIEENFKQKPKHVFQNKVMKSKHNPRQKQKKHGLQNKHNLIKCYNQINGTNLPQMK